MTIDPGSSAYRRIAASLADSLERQHSRLAAISDDEAQPQRNSAAMRRRHGTVKRMGRKENHITNRESH